MKYRVVKSGAVYKVQRKVYRVWVSVAMTRDLPLAIDVCAKMSMGQAGAMEGVTAVFRVETTRIWRRWGSTLVSFENRVFPAGQSVKATA